jgi:hypothetical protein
MIVKARRKFLHRAGTTTGPAGNGACAGGRKWPSPSFACPATGRARRMCPTRSVQRLKGQALMRRPLNFPVMDSTTVVSLPGANTVTR